MAAIQRLRDAGARIDGVVLIRNGRSGRRITRQRRPILPKADNPHGKELHNEGTQSACARSLPGR
jgi:hypothetical protein